jgi:DNA-binding ferritin-like protein
MATVPKAYKKAACLSGVLANDFALLAKKINYHWNVSTIKGMYSNMVTNDSVVGITTAEMTIENILLDHLIIQSQLKEIILKSQKCKSDPDIEELLFSVIRKHKIMSWMLRLHLVGDKNI